MDIPMLDPYPWEDILTDKILGDAQATIDAIKKKIDEIFDPGTAEAFGRTVNTIFDTIKVNAGKIAKSVKAIMDAFDANWDWVDFLDGVATGFVTMNDAITDLITTLLDLVPQFKDFLEDMPIFGDVFKLIFDNLDSGAGIMLGVTLALVPFRGAWKLLKGVLSPVLKIAKNLFSPFGKLVDKFIKLGKPAQDAAKGVEATGKALEGVAKGAEGVGKGAEGIGKATEGATKGAEGVGKAIEGAGKAAETAGKGAEGFFKGFKFSNVLKGFGKLTDKFLVFPGTVLDSLEGYGWNFEKVAENFKTGFDVAMGETDLASGLLSIFSNVFETVISGPVGMNSIARQMFSSMDTIASNTYSALKPIEGSFSEIFGSATSIVKKTFDDINGIAATGFSSLGNATGASLGGMVNDVRAKMGMISSDVSTNTTTSNTVGTSNFKSMATNIMRSLTGAVSSVSKDTGSMRSTSVENFSKIKSAASSQMGGVSSTVTTQMNKARDTTSTRIGQMHSSFKATWPRPYIPLPHINWNEKKIGPVTIPVFSGINWYAKGGIFDAATIAGIGEAGPEAVVPLTGAKMRPFAEAIASNIEGIGQVNVGKATMFNEDAFLMALTNAVYNAVVKGFPDDITVNTYLNATKVNDTLKRNNVQNGTGTSLVSTVK